MLFYKSYYLMYLPLQLDRRRSYNYIGIIRWLLCCENHQ